MPNLSPYLPPPPPPHSLFGLHRQAVIYLRQREERLRQVGRCWSCGGGGVTKYKKRGTLLLYSLYEMKVRHNGWGRGRIVSSILNTSKCLLMSPQREKFTYNTQEERWFKCICFTITVRKNQRKTPLRIEMLHNWPTLTIHVFIVLLQLNQCFSSLYRKKKCLFTTKFPQFLYPKKLWLFFIQNRWIVANLSTLVWILVHLNLCYTILLYMFSQIYSSNSHIVRYQFSFNPCLITYHVRWRRFWSGGIYKLWKWNKRIKSYKFWQSTLNIFGK
jgi:hypothetical protein